MDQVLKDRRIRWPRERRQEFSRIKRVWAIRYLKSKAQVQPQLFKTLQRLGTQYRLALVSSAHPETVKIFLRRSKTKRFFKAVLSSGDVPISKPSPRIYQAAIRRLGIRPSEGIAIEDTVSGATAAVRAGLAVIGMRGTCAPGLLIKTGAFKTVRRITDLLSYATHP